MKKGLTHFDNNGNAIMVDISQKQKSARTAIAKGCISMNETAIKAISEGTNKKGDVLAVARIGGIMAAKKCADLIPLCHPVNFDKSAIDFVINQKEKNTIEAECQITLYGKTGAEMEALTGVSVALLTIYDMCKALDKAMVIGNIRLSKKTGGKSGDYQE